MKIKIQVLSTIALLAVSTQALAQTPREAIKGSDCYARYGEKIKTKVARRQSINDALEGFGYYCAHVVGIGGLGYMASGYFVKGVAGTIPVAMPIMTGAMFACIGLYAHFDGRVAHAPKKLKEASQIAKLGTAAYRRFESEIREETPKANSDLIQRALAEGFESGDFCPGNRVMRPRGMKRYVSKKIDTYLSQVQE